MSARQALATSLVFCTCPWRWGPWRTTSPGQGSLAAAWSSCLPTHAYGAEAWLQTCLVSYLAEGCEETVLRKPVQVQLKWSNSSKFRFLHWFTWMLLLSPFSVSKMYHLQHLRCVNRQGRWNLICKSTYNNFSCHFCMLATQNLFLFKTFVFYGQLSKGRAEECETNNSLYTTAWVQVLGQLSWWKTENKGQVSPLSATPFRMSKNGDRSNRMFLFSE